MVLEDEPRRVAEASRSASHSRSASSPASAYRTRLPSRARDQPGASQRLKVLRRVGRRLRARARELLHG